MKVLLLDDEMLALDKLTDTASAVLKGAELNAFRKAKEALAFAESHDIDIAFLDIEMRGVSGMEVAQKLKDLNPKVNIIFCTGYQEYMPDAFRLYCSDYILKPVTEDKMERALQNLRYPIEKKVEEKNVRIRCYGAFEVFYKGEPVRFKYNRTKHMMAFLVHRNGVNVTTGEMMTELFEMEAHRSYFNKMRIDLITTFEDLGEPDVIRISRGVMGINREKVSCDYYDVLDGKAEKPEDAVYMEQYNFY